MTTQIKMVPMRRRALMRRVLRGAQLELRMLILLALLSVALSLVSPYFLTLSNILNLMDQSVITGIVAIGQTFVILIAGIDLSVGSLTGVTGIILGLCLADLPLPLAIVAAIASGGLAGFINGYIITKGRVAAFIVTLGMMSIGRSMAYVLSGPTRSRNCLTRWATWPVPRSSASPPISWCWSPSMFAPGTI
jgi:ribose transport system permease protein